MTFSLCPSLFFLFTITGSSLCDVSLGPLHDALRVLQLAVLIALACSCALMEVVVRVTGGALVSAGELSLSLLSQHSVCLFDPRGSVGARL